MVTDLVEHREKAYQVDTVAVKEHLQLFEGVLRGSEDKVYTHRNYSGIAMIVPLGWCIALIGEMIELKFESDITMEVPTNAKAP